MVISPFLLGEKNPRGCHVMSFLRGRSQWHMILCLFGAEGANHEAHVGLGPWPLTVPYCTYEDRGCNKPSGNVWLLRRPGTANQVWVKKR